MYYDYYPYLSSGLYASGPSYYYDYYPYADSDLYPSEFTYYGYYPYDWQYPNNSPYSLQSTAVRGSEAPYESELASPFTAATNGSGTTSGQQFYDDALAAFRGGEYEKAARFSAHALIHLPREARVHELMSLAMFALGNYRAAAMEAHAALVLGPAAHRPTLYSYYGNLPTYTRQLDALEKYLQSHPSSLRPLCAGLSGSDDGARADRPGSAGPSGGQGAPGPPGGRAAEAVGGPRQPRGRHCGQHAAPAMIYQVY